MKMLKINLTTQEYPIIKTALQSIRSSGFLLSEIALSPSSLSVSVYDFAELIARAEKTFENEMAIYRLRKEVVAELDASSFEYYLVAGVKIGYKANEAAPRQRFEEPMELVY